MSQPETEDLIALAERAVEKAKAGGAHEAECYISWSQEKNLHIQGGLASTRIGVDAGAGVRVVVGKRVGFASTSTLNEDELWKTVELALETAKIRPEDPKFLNLPDPIKRISKGGIYDESIATLTIEEMGEMLERELKSTLQHENIIYTEGIIASSIDQYAIANTRGINVGEKATGFRAEISCKAAEKGIETIGYDEIVSRKLQAITNLGENASQRALEMLKAKRLMKPQKTQVIFDNYTSPILLSAITYSISARAIQEGRSQFIDKIGEQVASKKLTIIDDSWMEDGIGTRAYDDEGVPTTVKTIIDAGILKAILYDSYTAHQEDKLSSGNAIRGDYSSTPKISPINLYVRPGEKPLEELIAQTDKGILVRYLLMGTHMTNPISGEFAVTAINAYQIKGGELHPLRPITISGNLYNAIKNIIEVGKDLKLHSIGKIPTIQVSNLVCGR